MNYILFEDHNIKLLAPFAINHASFELLCGVFRTIDRLRNILKPEDRLVLVTREEISDLVQERFPDLTVNPEMIPEGQALNGACLWDKDGLAAAGQQPVMTDDGVPVSRFLDEPMRQRDFDAWICESHSPNQSGKKIVRFRYLWDAVLYTGRQIERDLPDVSFGLTGSIHESAILVTPDQIRMNSGAVCRAGAVLDASAGPIILDTDVRIDIGALIQGPVYIGPGTVVNPGAKLRSNVSLGPRCKVGGELEDVIIQGYSNKQHDGFLGHSFLGEWINLGANTNNSDLKNNYGTVRFQFPDQPIQSGEPFLGLMMGDHSKSGISTMFNTGTYVGLGANVFGSEFQPKHIASFSWGNTQRVDLSKFLDTCRKVKKRRQLSLSDAEIQFLSNLHGGF